MAKFLDTSGLTYLWGKITAALGTKQNTLTPGTNISISNDTISATDTNRAFSIYSDTSGGAGPTEIVSSNSKKELRFYAVQSVDNLILTKFTETDDRAVVRLSATDTKPSNFATQTSAQEAAVSIGSDTNWHRIRQILGMTAGKLYLVEVSLMYPSATGGFRSIGISTSATNSSGYPDPTTSMGSNFFQNVAPVSGGAVTNVTLTTFFTPASGETYYLCGRQNSSGGSLSITPRYRIVQLN